MAAIATRSRPPGVERHQGDAARVRGYGDSSRVVPHASKMAAKPLAHSFTGAMDVNWQGIHNVQKDWVDKDRRRNVRLLANYKNLSADGSPKARPWAPLGDGRVTPGGASSRASTRSGSASERLQDARGFGQPPATGSSRGLSTASGPPGTSSTTLTCLWRRALSTPALRNVGTGDSSSQKGLPLEEWITADLADSMDKDEIGRLIEHVHQQVIEKRRRRQEAKGELAALKESKALRGAALAERVATPAAR